MRLVAVCDRLTWGGKDLNARENHAHNSTGNDEKEDERKPSNHAIKFIPGFYFLHSISGDFMCSRCRVISSPPVLAGEAPW
jgi:hypothetical protein